VAAPIRDAAGRVVGDVLLGWPDNRTDPDKEQRAARAAASAADRISAALGYEPAQLPWTGSPPGRRLAAQDAVDGS
jgi:hypothetical protein